MPHARLSQVALPPGCMSGTCSRAPRLYHQRPETAWQQNMDRLWSVPIVWFLLGPTTRTLRNLQHRQSHSRTLCLRSCSFRWLGTRRHRHHHRTQRTHRNGIQAGSSLHYRCLSQDAVRPGYVWLHPTHLQLEVTQRKLLIVN